jgi:hypothetical protein
MISSYLTRPQIPLAVALPQMLENIEAELAGRKLEDAEEWRLRWRAELIRWLLASQSLL